MAEIRAGHAIGPQNRALFRIVESWKLAYRTAETLGFSATHSQQAAMAAGRRSARPDDGEEEEGEEGEGWVGGGDGGRAAMAFPSVADGGVVDFGGANEAGAGWRRKKAAKSGGFESLGLSAEVLRGVRRRGYAVPTPIQRKALPAALAGRDVVAMARTGSGKTAAFLLPLLHRLRAHSPRAGARAVVLSPTRELALQTYKFCRELGRYTDLQAVHLVGGDSMEAQFEALAGNPDILVATPGRLMHHLSEVEGLTLRSVEYVVFDEADRLFEMGFAEQLRQIMSRLSDSRQTLLFSATMPRLLADFARAGLREPLLVRLDTDTKVSPDLRLEFFTLRHDERPAALLHLLREVIPAGQQTIVFASTKHHVEYLSELLRVEGMDASVVYGAMDQTARKIHIAKFRARKTFLLVVTDVAARGIDIPLLDNVVNYDFPPKPKLFVHRVGRAARAGRTGTAYSFLAADELPYLLDLHLFFSRPVRPAPTEEEIELGASLAQPGCESPVLVVAEDAVARGETVYGSFPAAALNLGMERVKQLIADQGSVGLLAAVSEKAFRLYCKTRPAASLESVSRAKAMKREGVHLALRRKAGPTEAATTAYAEHLKSFRPKQTVLEAEGDARHKSSKAKAAAASMVMRQKRAAHDAAIATVQRTGDAAPGSYAVLRGEEQAGDSSLRSDEDGAHPNGSVPGLTASGKRKRKGSTFTLPRLKQPKSTRDEEFFISGVPENRFSEKGLAVSGGKSGPSAGESFDDRRLDAEVLDLVPEDSEGVQKKRATYQWDKKNKKYVKLNAGEWFGANGKIKTESGAKVNEGNRGLYKKWRERTHLSVVTAGEEASPSLGGARRGGLAGRGRGGHRLTQQRRGPIPNAHVKSELRGVDEVRKSRQKKLAQQSRRGRGAGTGGRSRGAARAGRGRQGKKKNRGKR